MNTNKNKQNVDWAQRVSDYSLKSNHTIFKITKLNRRGFVLWNCNVHIDNDNRSHKIFKPTQESLMKLVQNNELTQQELNELISKHENKYFYCTRMDQYLKQDRKSCCEAGDLTSKQSKGFELFSQLLSDRGKHYKTTYNLLLLPQDYQGKYKKYPIRCESHGVTMNYSMQELNYNTSCPCDGCRKDPKHKNVAVPIILLRNSGREGQVGAKLQPPV